MNRNEEWNDFLDNLFSCGLKNIQATKEYEHREKRREHIDEMLTTNLTSGEKDMVDEVLFELGTAAEYEASLLYRQGLRDCIWLLKNLGVLA